jgi:hypothetical protein
MIHRGTFAGCNGQSCFLRSRISQSFFIYCSRVLTPAVQST